MIKEALQYIVGLAPAKIHEDRGYLYTDKGLKIVEEPLAEPFKTSTLTSIVEYIKSGMDNTDGGYVFEEKNPLIININNPQSIKVMSLLLLNSRCREYFMEVKADIPQIRFNDYYSSEDFNIVMQSRFVKNEDSDAILKTIGNLKESTVKSLSDDGVSQSVKIKSGIATVAEAKVPNPVTLKPYRTFIEVQQPESKFIFRMKEGGICGLFEADGGAWRITAVQNIKEYLMKELAEELKNRQVLILA